MQDDLVQLVGREEPVAADGRVVGSDPFERAAAQVAREDDVDDVLRREAADRCDRVDDRDRAFHRNLVLDPDFLGQLAVQRVDEALAGVHAAARQEPVLAVVLLVTAEQQAGLPAQQRRDPDPRLAHYAL